MRENAPEYCNKKPYFIMCAVVAAITALILLIFGAFALAPRIKSEKLKKEMLSDLSGDDVVTIAIVSDMRASNPLFGDSNGEQTLRDGAEINKLVTHLRASLENSVYDSCDDSGLGGWDIRIRLYFGDDIEEVFCSDGNLYFFDNGNRYILKTSDNELYKFVLSLLSNEN